VKTLLRFTCTQIWYFQCIENGESQVEKNDTFQFGRIVRKSA
jgi:hypothetical protein